MRHLWVIGSACVDICQSRSLTEVLVSANNALLGDIFVHVMYFWLCLKLCVLKCVLFE